MAVVVGGCRRARCSPLDRPLNVCMHVQLRMLEASNENERQIVGDRTSVCEFNSSRRGTSFVLDRVVSREGRERMSSTRRFNRLTGR